MNYLIVIPSGQINIFFFRVLNVILSILYFRKTALHFACENGSDNIVNLLIAKGADVNVPDEDNISPLYIASSKGHINLVRTLLNNGA